MNCFNVKTFSEKPVLDFVMVATIVETYPYSMTT